MIQDARKGRRQTGHIPGRPTGFLQVGRPVAALPRDLLRVGVTPRWWRASDAGYRPPKAIKGTFHSSIHTHQKKEFSSFPLSSLGLVVGS